MVFQKFMARDKNSPRDSPDEMTPLTFSRLSASEIFRT